MKAAHEICRWSIIDRRGQRFFIVKPFDPIHHIESRLRAEYVSQAMGTFGYESIEKALLRSIVPTITASGNRWRHLKLLD
jgi:hypothetical protein